MQLLAHNKFMCKKFINVVSRLLFYYVEWKYVWIKQEYNFGVTSNQYSDHCPRIWIDIFANMFYMFT